ncbi:MAG: TerC family protein [Verrucomicrobia bacterium]|nr:MAG: TerC family protein [Verrucomicrobiota bacterium]
MNWIFEPEIWVSLLTLTALEIVLGIDNIIFIAILVGKLPAARQEAARRAGLLAAMLMRILLLLAISWIMGLKSELFRLFGHPFSGRDLILLLGGVFLIAKATREIHDKLEGEGRHPEARPRAGFAGIVVQIMLLDIVFSLDSVITAVGMAQRLGVMIAAVVIAVGLMMFFAGAVSRFSESHPTLKMLALSFLLLVGVVLVADGLGQHINKGYIYFAMAFSTFVEALNLRVRKRSGGGPGGERRDGSALAGAG